MTAKPAAKVPKPAEPDDPMDATRPPDWLPSEFADPRGAWCLGMRELEAAGADTSGAMKKLRELLPHAWAERLIGASVENIRPRLAAAQYQKNQIELRISGLTKAGIDPAVVQRELVPVNREIAALTKQVMALEAWPGPNNAVLKARRDAAFAHYEECFQRLIPYRKHREFPVPEGWERELYEAEQAFHLADAAFVAGRNRLTQVSGQTQKGAKAAYGAMVSSLGNLAERLGNEAARIVEENDPDYLSSFPHRCPDSVVGLVTRAESVSALMDELGATHDLGLAHFWRGTGPVAESIIRGKCAMGKSFATESSGRNKTPLELTQEAG